MRPGKPHKKTGKIAAALPFTGGRSGSPFFLAAAIGLFCMTSYTSVSLQGSRNMVTDMFSPILVAINYPVEKTTSYIRAVTGIAHLQAENARLQRENIRLREWHQLALTLKEENAALHDLLNVKTEPDHRYISARVIADSGNAYVKSLLVMAGQNDGVKSKQVAVTGEGLMGRVIDSGKRASRILLLTDINSRIPVMIEKQGGHAILAGQNNSRPRLLHLPQDFKPQEGMTVLTSGQGGMFPAGIPVGTLSTDTEGRYIVTPFADPATTRYIKIIDKTPDPQLRTTP